MASQESNPIISTTAVPLFPLAPPVAPDKDAFQRLLPDLWVSAVASCFAIRVYVHLVPGLGFWSQKTGVYVKCQVTTRETGGGGFFFVTVPGDRPFLGYHDFWVASGPPEPTWQEHTTTWEVEIDPDHEYLDRDQGDNKIEVVGVCPGTPLPR